MFWLLSTTQVLQKPLTGHIIVQEYCQEKPKKEIKISALIVTDSLPFILNIRLLFLCEMPFKRETVMHCQILHKSYC